MHEIVINLFNCISCMAQRRMVSCLVLSCSDVEHAIWRHRGSVPPSGEMNGHQHNPLSAHVSWSQQNTHFANWCMNETCFRVLLSDPHERWAWFTLFILLSLPPGELPCSPVASRGWSDVFQLESLASLLTDRLSGQAASKRLICHPG